MRSLLAVALLVLLYMFTTQAHRAPPAPKRQRAAAKKQARADAAAKAKEHARESMVGSHQARARA